MTLVPEETTGEEVVQEVFKKGDKVEIKRDFDGIVGQLYGGVKWDEQHEQLKGKALEIFLETKGVDNVQVFMVKEVGETDEYFVAPEMLARYDSSRIIDTVEIPAPIVRKPGPYDNDTLGARHISKIARELKEGRAIESMSSIIKAFKEKHRDKFKDPNDFWDLLYEHVDMKDLLR